MIADGSIDKLGPWLAEMGLNGASEETLSMASAGARSTRACRSVAR